MEPLSIAITADPELPVPPVHYGGIERLVHLLVEGLMQRGHRVTLFAHPASQAGCRIEPYPGRYSTSVAATFRNACLVAAGVRRAASDVVHSFGRLAYLLPLLPLRIPKLMTYQRAITPARVAQATALAHGTLHFSGCSRHLIRAYTARTNWHVVYNGVPVDRFPFRAGAAADAPLMFLGRLEPIKGGHLAIDVARRSGRRLVIAGNVPDDPAAQAYYRAQIAPHVDGTRVCDLGPVDDRAKGEALAAAAALLMPVQWDEPFGLVMAEALACGTPVIALDRGAVPELVEHGRNGFVCRSVDEMVGAVARLGTLDRRACRRIAEERFSAAAVVGAYERLYREILAN